MIIHADDFGITLDQSKDILTCSAACGGEGALNSTSALVTSPAFGECAAFAKPFVDAGLIRMGMHFNLVEGPALSSPDEAPLIVGDDGRFQAGFGKLLAVSYGPLRNELTREVRQEARAQIRAFLQAFPDMQERFRVDSHQHTHMIPAVFDGVLAAVHDEGCTLEYLRIPAEPLTPYLEASRVREHVPPVNVVKNVLLNMLWKANAARYPQDLPEPALFFGLALSGRMQYAVNEEFLDKVTALASAQGREVELLFHPGGVANRSDCLDPRENGFSAFQLSLDRVNEARTLRSFPASPY